MGICIVVKDLKSEGDNAQRMHKGSQGNEQFGRLREGRDAGFNYKAGQLWITDISRCLVCLGQVFLCHLFNI